MMRWLSAAVPATLLAGSVGAGGWEFTAAIDVPAATGPKVFHHLESSGRRSLAVGDGRVAIAWEDEHSGRPQVYVAIKYPGRSAFADALLPVSGPGEAFEPSIVALPDARFALAWEEDERVRLRLLRFKSDAEAEVEFGEPVTLTTAPSGQPSLTVDGDRLLAVWGERHGRARRVRFARIELSSTLAPTRIEHCAVEPDAPAADQLYPTVIALSNDTVVAWEDRRLGHTIIMAATAARQPGCAFGAPQRISERPPGPKAPYGKGHGVARVALAAFGNGRALAAWEDKRDFRHGYDIYGAESGTDGRFGGNFRIQDAFGELSQQWHTALAGDEAGRVVAAWDDNRDGSADLFISWREAEGWSDDLQVPVASGPGQQQHPSIALDEHGQLHLAWTERPEIGAPTRLRYSLGRYRDD